MLAAVAYYSPRVYSRKSLLILEYFFLGSDFQRLSEDDDEAIIGHREFLPRRRADHFLLAIVWFDGRRLPGACLCRSSRDSESDLSPSPTPRTIIL